MKKTWEEMRREIELCKASREDMGEMEKNLIRRIAEIREEQGLTQTELAGLCHVKQPVIARMEKCVHSPQVNSLLKILAPLGYTLQIVPLQEAAEAVKPEKP